jgi:alkylhydroperoxidase family enzyme
MFLSNPFADDAVETLLRRAISDDGYVMNYVRLWAWQPDVHSAFSNARQLLASNTRLSAREVATLNTTTASRLGDLSCSIAWGSKLAVLCDDSTAAALLRGEDAPALTERERALSKWAASVIADPNGTTRTDVEALRVAGLSEQEIFDATVFVAFRLAFCTVNDALGTLPDRQLAQDAPPAVLASVNFGREVEKTQRT